MTDIGQIAKALVSAVATAIVAVLADVDVAGIVGAFIASGGITYVVPNAAQSDRNYR